MGPKGEDMWENPCLLGLLGAAWMLSAHVGSPLHRFGATVLSIPSLEQRIR